MWRMKVSAVIQRPSRSPSRSQCASNTVALEADVVGLGRRERGEVVRPRQGGGAGVQGVAVEAPRVPVDRALQACRAGSAVEEAVAVGPRAGVAAGVEPVRRRVALQDRDVRRQDGVEAQRVDRLVLVGADLPPGVHAAIGASGDGHGDLVLDQDRRQRALDLGLHRALVGLARPAGERATVVLEEHPAGHDRSIHHRAARPVLPGAGARLPRLLPPRRSARGRRRLRPGGRGRGGRCGTATACTARWSPGRAVTTSRRR